MPTPNADVGASLAASAKAAYSEIESGDALANQTLDATQAADGADLDGDQSIDLNAQHETNEDHTADLEDVAAENAAEPGDPEAAPEAGEATGEETSEEGAGGGVEKFEVGGQEVEVDFGKPEVRKRLVHAAHQRTVMKARAEKAEAQIKTLSEKAGNFDRLNEAYKEGLGPTGADQYGAVKSLLRALPGAGGEGLLKQLVAQEVDTQAKLAKMQPAEREAFLARREAEEARAERDAIKAAKAKADQTASEESKAQRESARQSAFDAEFQKVAFAGRLKDQTKAALLDRQVFAAAQAELAEVYERAEKEGIDPESIDIAKVSRTILKRHAASLRDLIKGEALKVANQEVESAAANATAKAQAIVGGAAPGASAPNKAGAPKPRANAAAAKPLTQAEVNKIIADHGYSAAMKAIRQRGVA